MKTKNMIQDCIEINDDQDASFCGWYERMLEEKALFPTNES